MDIIYECNVDQEQVTTSIKKPNRIACRGIVLNDENNIAAFFKNGKYYSYPGGGVENNEEIPEAFIRECKEEIGYKIEIINEIGKTIEHFDDSNNISHIFIAKVVEKIPYPTETDEDEVGIDLLWKDFDFIKKEIEEELLNAPANRKFRYEKDLAILERFGRFSK